MLSRLLANLRRLVTDPRTRIGYLLAVAVGVFFLTDYRALLAVCLLQVLLWLLLGQGFRPLVRRVSKLWVFILFITLAYALAAQDPATDQWIRIPALLFTIPVNLEGLKLGLAMCLRIVTVVLASQVARAGDPRAIASGLRQLGVPGSISVTIDAVLALFGGKARKSETEGSGARGIAATVRRMRRGDVGVLVDRFEEQVARAEEHIAAQGSEQMDRSKSRDIAIIAGIALTMLGIRALKVLPGMPIPPGHKLILLTPLYVTASLTTRGRFSATLTGLTMGVVSFLMGDGRYGIFAILKHLAPGVVCDLGLAGVRRREKLPGPLFWSLFGSLVAVARFATMFAIVLFVQAPGVAYALLIPGLTSNVIFGILSGLVTWHLVKRLEPLRLAALEPTAEGL